MKARKFFFLEGVSKYGAIEDMQIHLGNYAQETISVFRDLDGTKIYISRIFEVSRSACKQVSRVPDVNTRRQGRVVPLQPKSNRRFWAGNRLCTRESRTTILIAVGSIYGL